MRQGAEPPIPLEQEAKRMIIERKLPHDIASCPRCSDFHRFELVVKVEKEIALFGGPGERQRSFDVSLECPNTGELFEEAVTVAESADESVQSISVVQGPLETPDELRSEREDWLKGSAAAARQFAQTMLSTSLGAIPIYFAVVNFIGVPADRVPLWLGVLPPALFMAAAASFVYALRPAFRVIRDQDDFVTFRNERLTQLNLRLTRALVILAIAVMLTAIVFTVSLFK